MRHEARERREHEAHEALEHKDHDSREARQHIEHEAHEAREYVRHKAWKARNLADSRICKTSGIYFTGPTLKEEAMNIKSSLEQPRLEDFKASEGQLDKWGLTDGIFEKQLSEEFLDVQKLQKNYGLGGWVIYTEDTIWKTFGLWTKVVASLNHSKAKYLIKNDENWKEIEAGEVSVIFLERDWRYCYFFHLEK